MGDDVEQRIYVERQRRAADQFAGTPFGSLTITDPEPVFLRAPVSAIDRAFVAFHADHPDVYAEYERRALAQVRQGETRISISLLTEAIRATTHKQINNSFRAHYARMLRHDHPELHDAIVIRGVGGE